jgi:hypothetical protein
MTNMKLVQKRLLGKQEPGYISHKANMHRYMNIVTEMCPFSNEEVRIIWETDE